MSQSNSLEFNPVEEVIAAIKMGQAVIVTDDAERENEADLVCAAEFASADMVNFMATHGRGLICAPLSAERADQLGLELMTRHNREAQKTAFTISVDAAHHITTGISAGDRSVTLKLLADPNTRADQLVQPGHIFPLRAVNGGVLRRAGHTEAAVDLAHLAGLQPAGVICEIMRPDGEMARAGDLGPFQREHQLKACTIADLIEYRRLKERQIQRIETIDLPTNWGLFRCHLFEHLIDGSHHLALTKGEISPDSPTLVRVHSECLTGDVFMSQRCDCGGQLHDAMTQIAEHGGVLLYLRQEGRGIGLPAKIRAYKLQEQGLDTVDANLKLGFPSDLRHYGMGAQMLRDVGVRKIRLLTNNPKKVIGLKGYNLEIIEQLPIRTSTNPHNEKYLNTKKLRMGHNL